ncbi:MAG: TetR/AcrR family transcriptional regulator [Pseudomonadota bacterium]
MLSDRRLDVIETSSALFLDKGFAGTSMSMIAKRCGLTKASLYHHFSGKEELFVACVTHGYRAALDGLEGIVADRDEPPLTKLRAALSLLYETTIVSPVGRMSPLIAEVSRTFPFVARSFHGDYIAPQQDMLWTIVEEGVAAGDFKKVDRKLLFHLIFGPMVTLSLSREMFASFEDLDDHFPITPLKEGHIEVIVQMLVAE